LKIAGGKAAFLVAIAAIGAISMPAAHADRDISSDPGSVSVPKDGVIDDNAAGWTWAGMSSIADDMLRGGTAHAGGPQSSATYVFHGTGVEVFTVTGPTVVVDGHAHKPGTINISVDGKPQGTFSPRSATVNYEVSAGKVSGLADGNHVLEISSQGGWFAVDYIKLPVTVGTTSAGPGNELPDPAAQVNYKKGFPADADLQLNGTARIANNAIVFTDGQFNQLSSIFTNQQFSAKKFKTSFRIQFVKSEADGIVFCIQPNSPRATGKTGADIGYGGIGKSMGVKFDLYDNAGEGTSSTGLYFNGFTPTAPFIDLAQSGIILRSGHPIDVTINYNGKILTVSETDIASGASASQDYPVDIPGMIGPSGYVGFTSSTGGSAGTQVLHSWTFNSNP